MASQAKQILNYLQEGNRITIMESFNKFGITSLHRRLTDLKEQGHRIEAKWKELPSGKRVKEYYLNHD